MAKPRILYITEEIVPYLPENPNSGLGRDLPVMSQSVGGYEVRIFMPRFGTINERRNQLHEVIRLSGINIPIADADHPLIIKVASMHPSRIQVYFIDNDDYFQRLDSDANPLGTNRADNDERAIFFTRGTMETVKKLRWEPRVVHCMGWMAALSTMYLDRMYKAEPGLVKPKVIYTMLPGQNPDTIDGAVLDKLREEGYTDADMQPLVDNPTDPDSFHKLAMSYADAIAVGPDASPEITEFARATGKPMLMLEPEYTAKDFQPLYDALAEK